MKITRNLLREFYGIGATPTYHYINTGFVKMAEENSPEVEETAFVGNKNGSPTIAGYKNKWTYEAQNISDNAVCADLVAIARQQKTGSDCERVLVSVDMSMADSAVSGSYYARKFAVAVEASGPSGDPKSITKVSGSMHQIGDLSEGIFNPTTLTWADTVYTPAA